VPVEDAHPQDSRAHLPADLVADRVADDRGDDHDKDDQPQHHVASAGGDAAEHGGGLAGDDEPDEQRVLREDDHADEDVDQDAGNGQHVVDQGPHVPCLGEPRGAQQRIAGSNNPISRSVPADALTASTPAGSLCGSSGLRARVALASNGITGPLPRRPDTELRTPPPTKVVLLRQM